MLNISVCMCVFERSTAKVSKPHPILFEFLKHVRFCQCYESVGAGFFSSQSCELFALYESLCWVNFVENIIIFKSDFHFNTFGFKRKSSCTFE